MTITTMQAVFYISCAVADRSTEIRETFYSVTHYAIKHLCADYVILFIPP